MTINILLENQIKIPIGELPSGAESYIKRGLTLKNPKFEQIERYSRWNYNSEPEFLTYFDEGENCLMLPRGYMAQLVRCLDYYNIDYQIRDETRKLPNVNFSFNGDLHPFQDAAVSDVLNRRYGILESPTGSGKTVMALNIIAQRKQPALVVVHTKELLYQWRDRAVEFLGLDPGGIGLVGDGHKRIGDKLTIGIINSLYRIIDEVNPFIGHVIVDECHHTPARTFTDVVGGLDAFYLLGLSATPYRRDGLTKVIYYYMGDRAHQICPAELQADNRIMQARLEVRHTDFDFPNASGDYQGMLTALVEDQTRNEQIVSDVVNQVQSGKGIALIISDRVSHCRELYENISSRGIEARLLTGRTPARERAAIVEDLRQGKAQTIVSTAQLIGEGFDLKDMSSIFMTTPVRFTGRVKQYIGRVLRVADGKDQALIFDYVDKNGLLQHTFKSRLAAYKDMRVALQ